MKTNYVLVAILCLAFGMTATAQDSLDIGANPSHAFILIEEQTGDVPPQDFITPDFTLAVGQVTPFAQQFCDLQVVSRPTFALEWQASLSRGIASYADVVIEAENTGSAWRNMGLLAYDLENEIWYCSEIGRDTTRLHLVDPQTSRFLVWIGTTSGYSVTAEVSVDHINNGQGGSSDSRWIPDPDGVSAASNSGLDFFPDDSDTDNNNTTTERLDYTLSSNYGSVELTPSNFTGVYTQRITSGGTVNIQAHLGEISNTCRGWATASPDFSVRWGVQTEVLYFYFIPDGPANQNDTTMVVNEPDGDWLCADDEAGNRQPYIFSTYGIGRYDIWIGSYNADESITGTLFITTSPSNVPVPW